jgi:LmbE family N-acetylglucosaminyl deacetylase
MKHTRKSTDRTPLLAFGAHPDDIEFACGAIVARESASGRAVHFVVCSRGEAASNGTPKQRQREAGKSAAILGAKLKFIELDGDAKLEMRSRHALKLALIIRAIQPGIVLAPSLVEDQHPDHWRLGKLVRDAARLARYGGLKELCRLPPHAIEQLLYYAVTSEAEPVGPTPLLVDVSEPQIMRAWTKAMEAHVSQHKSRNYLELQLTRARLNGLRAGVDYAVALYSDDPIIVDSLAQLGRGARHF